MGDWREYFFFGPNFKFSTLDIASSQPKASNLMIPLKPSVRAMAEKRAAEGNRSLATYISQLIVADAKANESDRRKKGFSD